MRTPASFQKFLVLYGISILFLIHGILVIGSYGYSEPPNDLFGDALIANTPPIVHQFFSSEPQSTPPIENYDTSEYLLGQVAVGIILLESNGTKDLSSENWTNDTETQVINEIQTGLSWLANQNPNAKINFTYQINLKVPTSYEPITRPSTDRTYWISEALTYMGFPGDNYFIQTYSYIQDLKTKLHTDWAFAIFVVDSYQDIDGCFTDNRADQLGKTCAFSYLGGPLLVMTFDNGNYRIENMDYVVAHETCHIFYATDEYDGTTQKSGYLGTYDNEECTCMMNTANTRWLCNNAKAQLGWRDTDNDTIDDILDTNPTCTLNPYNPNPTTETYLRYNGSITDNPYPNQNPYGSQKNITINTIKAVYYRIDQDPWLNATALDGTFDQSQEDYYMYTTLNDGNHTIEVYGINSVGNPNTNLSIDNISAGDITHPTTNVTYDEQWYTNDFTITLTANDTGKGVLETYYQINNDSTKTVSIDGQPTISTEGTNNTVKYWSIDKAGNIEPTKTISNLKLDKTPPTGTLTINEDATFTTSPNVTLSMESNDATSGVSAIRLSNDPLSDSQEWQNPVSFTTWVLQDIEGNRTIYYQIKDYAGLISTYNATICLDTTPPDGQLTINNGALYANTTTLNLLLSANDNISGVSEMRFSNDSTSWSNWKPYTTTENYTITDQEGTKNIYVQYRNNAQLVSTYSNSIYLDMTKPNATIDQNEPIYAGITLTLSAQQSQDNIGIANYTWIFHDNSTSYGQSTTYTYTVPGTYTVQMIACDVAGNIATTNTTVTVLEKLTQPTNPTPITTPTPNPTTKPTQIPITPTPTPTNTPVPTALPTDTTQTPTPTTNQAPPQPTQQNHNLPILLGIIAVIVVIILTTIGLFYWIKKRKTPTISDIKQAFPPIETNSI